MSLFDGPEEFLAMMLPALAAVVIAMAFDLGSKFRNQVPW
jgi:hypothetical protein